MAVSPRAGLQDIMLQVKIKLNGSAMNELYGIESVTVNHYVNRISTAEILLRADVEIDSGAIPISDGDDLSPGVKIDILAGYNDSPPQSIFQGFIVKHSIDMSAENFCSFRIVCKHEAVKMTYNQREAYFATKKDSDIMSTVLGNYSGITSSVKATTDEYENVYQKMSTDWDFILSRCDFNGFIVCMDTDTLKIDAPDVSSSPVLKVEAGVSLLSFQGELNAENQPTCIEASAWDAATQALLSSTASEPTVNEQGNITPKKLSENFAQDTLKLLSTVPMTSSELKAWADGILLRKRLNAFRGKVRFQGSPLAKTGTLIELDGVGKKFNGNAFISGVEHMIETGSWVTAVTIGLEQDPIHQKKGFSYAPATGQLPAMHGIYLATVKKIDEDPASLTRIQVTIPSFAETQADTWARMAHFYASGDVGSFFLPEVGDEVAVGFFDNDPRYPVILGSLYNGNNKPPFTPESKNSTKAIVTKSKMKLTFDEEKKIITLITPGNNMIVISDDGKSIELKDQNNNSVKLSSGGIDLDSAKDINIKAKGNITIDAMAKVNITAKQDVAVSGLNINATANVGFTAKGNATAEVSASGQTTVKGGIVMIN